MILAVLVAITAGAKLPKRQAQGHIIDPSTLPPIEPKIRWLQWFVSLLGEEDFSDKECYARWAGCWMGEAGWKESTFEEAKAALLHCCNDADLQCEHGENPMCAKIVAINAGAKLPKRQAQGLIIDPSTLPPIAKIIDQIDQVLKVMGEEDFIGTDCYFGWAACWMGEPGSGDHPTWEEEKAALHHCCNDANLQCEYGENPICSFYGIYD